jgi:catechol 2,3-dioxygenase-like lactoylglutathione lyase family enzyme
VAAAAWYTKYLGLKVVRAAKDVARTHFLADSSGTVMLEIYNNPPDQVPPYAKMDPLLLHIAFVSKDPEADKAALLAAGATLVVDQHLDDGSHLVMMRDPWGLAIQLCKRATPMLTAG